MKKLANIIFILFLTQATLFAYTYEVKRGDTLISIFKDIYTYEEIIQIDKILKTDYPEYRLLTGQKITFLEDKVKLKYSINKNFIIQKNEGKITVTAEEFPIFKLKTIVEGEIKSSLFESIKETGEDDILAIMLAEIFEWEIDFFKDIRSGDRYKLIVEKKFCKGKFIGYGKILAADFINQGRLIRALYYENEKTAGYFTPDGKSLKKGFLKAPLKFGRVTSGFTSRRLHPILNVVRPHYGVDYAAPYGTPVHATADGKIVERGYKKGNGNYVKIRHNNGYETTYMHFSKFRAGQRVGSFVKQGEIIGYVGSTGYSTGPHVDYRIIKNGRYLNPLTFKSPAKSLPKDEIESFLIVTKNNSDMLDNTYYKYAKFTLVR